MSSAKYADKFATCSRLTAQELVFIPCYLHFFREEQARPVRIGLRTQPRSRVSVARLSRSCALRAASFALTGAQVGQSGLTDLGERSANKSRVSPGCCARGSAPAPLHHRANSAQMLKVGAQVGCDATALEKFRRPEKRCPCVLPVQFRRSAGAFTRTRSGEG